MKEPEPYQRMSKGVRKAQRALEKNRAAIEASSRGTPSGRRSSWKLGKGPGSTRDSRG
jgi:hypothetical protein